VIKMRGGNHSKDIREYIISDEGVVVIGPRQTDYVRLTTGLPERIGVLPNELPPEPKARLQLSRPELTPEPKTTRRKEPTTEPKATRRKEPTPKRKAKVVG